MCITGIVQPDLTVNEASADNWGNSFSTNNEDFIAAVNILTAPDLAHFDKVVQFAAKMPQVFHTV